MSDVPPKRVNIPDLPMEIMLEIFYLCDVSTILNTRATCTFWRKNLSSYAFLEEIARRWKSKGCSIFAHFGYSSDWTKSLDWVMNMSALTGETSPLHFPFLLTAEGWFQIVGVENGIVCIRYSSMGNKSYLLTWNPISRYSKIISDPNKHYCEGCVFLYSFLYYPSTLDYALLHVYMENPDSSTCVLTMYTSFRRNWNVTVPCPENARRLNPAYVSVNGVVYWVSVITDEEDIQPPYIVSFNIITYSFDQISLPNEGLQGSHTLLVRSGHLCVAANIGDDYSYYSVIWQLDQNSSSFNWTKLFSNSGIGPSYIPATIVDDDIIQIKERHLEVEDIHDFRFTHFHIRRYSPVTGSKKTLQWVNYDNVVKLWTPQILPRTIPGVICKFGSLMIVLC